MNNNQTKPGAMAREDRYIVIKRKDLEAASGDSHTGVSEAEVALRDHLDSWQVGTRSALVIESDWPEYEPAWRMIEARVNGAEQPPAVGGELEVFGFGIEVSDYARMFAKTREKADTVAAHYIALGHTAPVGELIDRAHVAPLLAELEQLKREDNRRYELYMGAEERADHALACLKDAEARIAELEAGQGEPVAIPAECPHMIVFDDSDIKPITFAGHGARDAALKTWLKVSGSWNAHLFVRVERNSRDDRYPSARSQSATAKVVLPERLNDSELEELEVIEVLLSGQGLSNLAGTMAAARQFIDEIAKLNGGA